MSRKASLTNNNLKLDVSSDPKRNSVTDPLLTPENWALPSKKPSMNRVLCLTFRFIQLVFCFGYLPDACLCGSIRQKHRFAHGAGRWRATALYDRGPGVQHVILLHGYAETSRMWKPIMPLLAETIYRHCTRPAGHR